jgi:hypothetical protein
MHIKDKAFLSHFKDTPSTKTLPLFLLVMRDEMRVHHRLSLSLAMALTTTTDPVTCCAAVSLLQRNK